jgi:hypothetical protein
MKYSKVLFSFLLFSIASLSLAQKEKTNSDTRQFIDNADFTQVNRNWNIVAKFTSGVGETVEFYPVEAIDLKANKSVKSLQMDMTVNSQNGVNYFKSSWIDLSEIEEFIYFLEQYIIPNLKDKAENKQSKTYIFNSKEITFSFRIGELSRRTSIYLKDNGITDTEHYFWTETQVSKIPDLLEVLKKLR